MKPIKQSLGQPNSPRVGVGVLLGFLLLPVLFLALTESDSCQLAILNLQLSIRTYRLSPVKAGGVSEQPGGNLTTLSLAHNDSIVDKEIANLNSTVEEKQGRKINTGIGVAELPPDLKEKQVVENKSIIVFETANLVLEENKITLDDKEAETNASQAQVPTKKQEQNHTSEVYQVSSEEQDHIKTEAAIGVGELPSDSKEKQVDYKPVIGTKETKLEEEKNTTPVDDKESKTNSSLTQVSSEKQEQTQTSNSVVPESKLFCDRSEPRSDTCSILGDVRVLGKSSTVLLASPSQLDTSSENSTWKIRPYSRKWEAPVMERIRELSLKHEQDTKLIPACSVNHTVPAVIFSTGGFLGNVFHDFTDVLVPLFATSHQFQGEVQFLATDFNSKWLDKYQRILKQLSHYKIINMDADDRVHCFPEVHVGLKSHKVFGMDPSKTPNGYTMIDFKQMLRASFSLNRESIQKIAKRSKKKPRLMIILRKGSRSIMNAKEVIKMARAIGYKVIAVAPEDTKDLARFSQVVNSCDVMMGVHGAGLSNMVFLPTNATIVQVVPWGDLKWACRHDFGEPAPDMGLNYVEYEIKEEESSLIEEYPRNHAVFTDPASIQKQGWNMLWYIFLNKQKVKLDVGRFRGVLLEIYHTLKQ